MRFLTGLAMLLMVVPGACSLPSEPVLITLKGQQVGADVVLEWEVLGGPLTALELLRVDAAGTLAVFVIDPTMESYVDADVSASGQYTYILYAEFDGGVTASNAYHSVCPYVVYNDDPPDVDVRPECINLVAA